MIDSPDSSAPTSSNVAASATDSDAFIRRTIEITAEELVSLFGPAEVNLHIFTNSCAANIGVRGNELTIVGTPEQVADAENVFSALQSIATKDSILTASEIYQVINPHNDHTGSNSRDSRDSRSDDGKATSDTLTDHPHSRLGFTDVGNTGDINTASSVETSADSTAIYVRKGKIIRPKTAGQRHYVSKILSHDIVFGIGPAGTGKTFLAVAMAVQALHRKEVRRIILTRPAVEAGEHLGFLPGSASEKIDPYLRPLWDSLCDLLEPETVNKLLAMGVIEVAPLAYMRGRTLNEAYILLDEAQNTTIEQMKMFLTRLGVGSRMVITGDLSQVDLRGQKSGLYSAQKVLNGIDGIYFAHFTSADVLRHRLVGAIVDAYSLADRQKDDSKDNNNTR